MASAADGKIPRVSVLMTIYDAAPFLRQSIESLLAQEFMDWELIAVENGSVDASPSILAGYKDPRIRVFTFKNNIGRTPGLRYALAQARGEYMAVLDADDMAHPGRLRREAAFLDGHPETVLVGTWATQIDREGKVFGTLEPPVGMDQLYDGLGACNLMVHSSVMFRKEAAEEAGGYPQRFCYAQDFALILSLAKLGKLAMIAEPLCFLRVMPGSMTHAGPYRLAVVTEELELMRLAGEVLPLSAAGRRMNRQAVARREFRVGRAMFFNGRFFSGLRMMVLGTLHFLTTHSEPVHAC